MSGFAVCPSAWKVTFPNAHSKPPQPFNSSELSFNVLFKKSACLPALLPLDNALNLIEPHLTSYWLVPSGYGSVCGDECHSVFFTFMLSVWFQLHENLGPIFNPLLCHLQPSWFTEHGKCRVRLLGIICIPHLAHPIGFDGTAGS